MRCIEMQAERILQNPLARLTLTWDVLKCHSIKYAHLSHSININMRCIEMVLQNETISSKIRLTLTWDVLKYYYCCSAHYR